MEQVELSISILGSSVKEETQICVICGSNHNAEDCTYLSITNHILDKEVPTKARLSLPDELMIQALADGTNRIITKKFISKGTRFGPIEALNSFSLNPSIQFPLKVFPYEEEDFLEYYLDTSNEQNCTWMMFVELATNYEEQNLICYQDKQSIYYAAITDINECDCLKVWYSPYYAKKMGKNILVKEKSESIKVVDINKLINSQQKILNRDCWTCKFCGSIKGAVSEFAQHIIEHYVVQLRKTCEICKGTFTSRKSLWKHMNLMHNPHKRKKKPTLKESPKFSSNQNTLKELSIGGPLLNNMELIDNFDNSNLLVPTSNHLYGDLNNMETENLNIDNFLSENVKALDHFNFDIGDCQEEFVCDICVKSFAKLRYLIHHLRKHTGENYCSNCKKIFCRKENFQNHSCIKGADYKCEPCNRVFLQKKYYRRHIAAFHDKKFKCSSCSKSYCNKYELTQHNCKAQPSANLKYSCSVCQKQFAKQLSLRKHMLRFHSQKRKMFVCHICSKQYSDKSSHDVHMKNHEEPEFQCKVCHRKFHRKDVYQSHLQVHDDKKIECDICKKEFSSSKSLFIHKNYIHVRRKFQCITCDATFSTKSNLTKHGKTHLIPFKNGDLETYCTCQYCGKKMKLKSSLQRHIARTHPDRQNAAVSQKLVKIDKKEQEPTFSLLNDDDLDLQDSQDNIDLINDADMNDLERNLHIIDNILLDSAKEMGLSDDILSLNNLEMSTLNENVSKVESREICLSMPDLMEQDQDITLGDNAYILDNGTIVEPQGHSDNVVVYVLNEPKT